MPDLLIELFSEDIPARMQARAAQDLQRLITDRLTAGGLTFAATEAHVTPRRLALAVTGIPAAQPTVREEKRGPRVGAPDAALQGFFKSAGVSGPQQCEQRDTGKGVFWFAVIEKPGRETAQMLPELVEGAIRDLPWPKSMRWSDSVFRWVRPLHSIIALFDGAPLPGGLTVANREPASPLLARQAGVAAAERLPFGAATRGHRFLAPDAFTVSSFADYQAKLRAARVLLDREERKALIAAETARLAAAAGLTVEPDDGLLEEVAGLVEWPVVLMGAIDPQFMDVPAEVLITSMRTHQKYFATRNPDGSLGARFIVVANTLTADGGAAVVAGNQRVLRARLSDARFFWDQDRKERLDSRLPALADITFHAKLGTVADKVQRLEALASTLSASIPGGDATAAARAAQLAKADLVTGMVGEFPELQGIMGRYYALHQGESPAIAAAVAEHYKPLGPGDSCPTAPVSVAVALADKLDTLTGFFAIDEKPTGSKDPYALRRAALGVIRLILENRLRLPLLPAFRRAHSLHRAANLATADTVAPQLLEFFADRLKVVLRDRGVRHDLIDAVFALGDEDDLVRLLARVEALSAFLGSDDGANLLTAYRRAANIVRIEEKKDGVSHAGAPDPAQLVQDEEKALAAAVAAVAEAARPHLAAEDFAAAMTDLARLRAPLDAFFAGVTVNAAEAALRVNRLRLLAQIRATMDGIADFSRVEG